LTAGASGRLGREAALYRGRAAHHIRHEARRKKPILAVASGSANLLGEKRAENEQAEKGGKG